MFPEQHLQLTQIVFRELTFRWPSIILWGFDSFSFLLKLIGFSWILLSWLSEVCEFFAVLQGESGPTGFKTGTLSFVGFSLWYHVFEILRWFLTSWVVPNLFKWCLHRFNIGKQIFLSSLYFKFFLVLFSDRN